MPIFTFKCAECGFERDILTAEYVSTKESYSDTNPCEICGCCKFMKTVQLFAKTPNRWLVNQKSK